MYFTTEDGKLYIDTAGDGSTSVADIGVNRIPVSADKTDRIHLLNTAYNSETKIYTASLSTPLEDLNHGFIAALVINSENLGEDQFAFSGFGAKPLYVLGRTVNAKELAKNSMVFVVYDKTNDRWNCIIDGDATKVYYITGTWENMDSTNKVINATIDGYVEAPGNVFYIYNENSNIDDLPDWTLKINDTYGYGIAGNRNLDIVYYYPLEMWGTARLTLVDNYGGTEGSKQLMIDNIDSLVKSSSNIIGIAAAQPAMMEGNMTYGPFYITEESLDGTNLAEQHSYWWMTQIISGRSASLLLQMVDEDGNSMDSMIPAMQFSGLTQISDGTNTYMAILFSSTFAAQLEVPENPESELDILPVMMTMVAGWIPDEGYGIFELTIPSLAASGGQLSLGTADASTQPISLLDSTGTELSTISLPAANSSQAGLLSATTQTVAGEKIFTGYSKFRNTVYFQGATQSPTLQFSSTSMAVNKNYGYISVSGFQSGAYPTLNLCSKYSDGTLQKSHSLNLVTGLYSGTAAKANAFASAKSVTLTGDVTGTASSTGGWEVPTTLADTIEGDKTFSDDITIGKTLKLYNADLSGSYSLPGTLKLSMDPINNSDGYTTGVVTVKSFNPGAVLRFDFDGNEDNAPIEGIGSTSISMGLFGDGDRSEIHADYFSGTAASASTATKVGKNLTIKLNSGATEGTNLFTFNGSAAKTINITPAAIGAAAASHGNHVPATQTADNTIFLRNDNSWATVTPNNIGAATENHGIYYGTCASASADVEKVVTLTDATGFSLTEGAVVIVKFTNTNTASSPTMNVNSTGAKPLCRYGSTTIGTATTTSAWYAGSVITFVYDGTAWVRNYWYNTTYSTFGGATTSAAGTSGLVPAPSAGSTTRFLRADKTWAVPTNTQNTAGAGDSSSKLFIVGRTAQSTGVSYSHDTAYIGTDGCLYSDSTKVSVEGHTHDYVPTTRTVNGKALSADISLTYTDVGAAAASHGTHVTASSVKSALGTGTGTSKYLREDGTWVTPPDTNTKVTSAANHYTPSADTSAALGVDASSTTAATWGATSLVTGVNIQRDAKGHVTGVSVDSIQMPANPDTNTHYTTKLFATTSSGTAHAATTNGNTYLRLFDNTTARQSIKIVGSGATTVTSDANGVITISSTDTNTNTDTNVTTTADTSSTKRYVTTTSGATTGTLKYHTGVYVNHSTGVLMGAAWNDYAEFRSAKQFIQPGRVAIENGDDTLSMATERLMPGANIVSDTYGFAIGETEINNTPIAVSGRALAYPYEPRDTYAAGDPVCSGPNGTVSKMTREEVMKYPDRMIGTVSAIPDYETYGEANTKVNGRIWIKVI